MYVVLLGLIIFIYKTISHNEREMESIGRF